MKKNLTIFESGSCFIFAILAMTIFQTILSLAFTNTTATFGGMSISNWVIYVANQVVIVAVVVIFTKVKKTDFVQATRIRGKLNIKQILLLPLISVFTIVAFLPLSQMFANLLFLLGWKGAISVPLSSNVGVYFLSVFAIALLPAFGEELLMRGALLSGLKSRTPAFAVLISALMFSLMHANAIQTVYQFFIGIVLCVVCIWSKSLVAPMVVHFLNNLVSLTITAYVPALNNFDLGSYNYLLWFGCILVGTFALVFLLFLFREVSTKKSNRVWSQTNYENFSIYTTDESATAMLGHNKRNIFSKFGVFLKGLFTKQGWKEISSSLEDETSYTAPRNNQSVSVWLALGFIAFWWLVALIQGFL